MYIDAIDAHEIKAQVTTTPATALSVYVGRKVVSSLYQRVTAIGAAYYSLANTTAVTILDGTTTGGQAIDELIINNLDASSRVVEISFTDGTNTVLLKRITLAAGYSATIKGNGNYTRYDAAGDPVAA